MTDKDDVDSLNEEVSETKRKWRNLSEKKRRDSFNTLIAELANIVSTNGRKVDKSNVLKQTIAYLQKNNRTVNQVQQADSGNSPASDNFRPSFLSNEEFLYLLVENLEAFILVITCNEQIVYISDKLKEILDTDYSGKYLHDFVDEQSCSSFKNVVAEQMHANGPRACDEAGFYSLKWKFLHSRQGFETANIAGQFKSLILSDDNCSEFGLNCVSNEEILCFVGIGKFVRFPLQTIFRVPAKVDKVEFVCKFNMEWKFIDLDQKSVNITGYSKFELIGLSGYEFYHSDDLDDIVSCHENIIKNGEAISGPYRFKIKADRWIWLKSHYTIVYSQWASKPECVVSTNQILHGEILPLKAVNETVSTTTAGDSKKLQVKCEPVASHYCDTKDSSDYGRQVFRPQPGVCIEHSPISSNNGSKNQRKQKLQVANGSANVLLDESNAQLYELLLQRENSLKQEIMKKEKQVQTLQRQYQVRSLTPEAKSANNSGVQNPLVARQSPQALLQGTHQMAPPVSPFPFHQRFEAPNGVQQLSATREVLSMTSPQSNTWSPSALNLHINNGTYSGPRLPY